MEIFKELSVIIFIALTVSLLMKWLKQPLIVGYIITGILVGENVFSILKNSQPLELFSKIGIVILLFIVGLSLSPKVIKEVGKVSLYTGLGQVIFTSVIGFFIAKFLGLANIEAMFVAVALTFSSTIIILKLLSDKGDLNTLYGKVAIGFLLVQDIVATIVLLVATAYSGGESQNIFLLTVTTVGKGALLITAIFTVSNFVIPKLSKFVATSQELLFLFSISFALAMATLFSLVGFSVEIGALVAGVTLSMTPYSYEFASRMRPLRDFFILIFFVLLGSQLEIANIGDIILPAVVLSVFVLIGNPVIVIVIMNLLGFSRRTAFQAGLTVAQISEFSLILATLAFEMGSLSSRQLSLITLVGLITIAGSTYLILYSDKIFPRLEKFLAFLELKKASKDKDKNDHPNALLFGYRRVGHDFVEAFEKLSLKYLIIDFDPDSIKTISSKNLPYRYGDAKDSEFLEELGFKNIKIVVSTVPEYETNLLLLNKLRDVNKRAIFITIGASKEEAVSLYEMGASYVILPHYIGAKHTASLIIKNGFDKASFGNLKEKHLRFLEEREV